MYLPVHYGISLVAACKLIGSASHKHICVRMPEIDYNGEMTSGVLQSVSYPTTAKSKSEGTIEAVHP